MIGGRTRTRTLDPLIKSQWLRAGSRSIARRMSLEPQLRGAQSSVMPRNSAMVCSWCGKRLLAGCGPKTTTLASTSLGKRPKAKGWYAAHRPILLDDLPHFTQQHGSHNGLRKAYSRTHDLRHARSRNATVPNARRAPTTNMRWRSNDAWNAGTPAHSHRLGTAWLTVRQRERLTNRPPRGPLSRPAPSQRHP
jgi:hypothetical protein